MRYLRICRFKSKIRLERSSWGSTPLENQIHLLLISVRVYKDSNKHSNNLSKDLVQSWGYLPLKNPKIKKKYKTPPISTFHNTQTIQRLKKTLYILSMKMVLTTPLRYGALLRHDIEHRKSSVFVINTHNLHTLTMVFYIYSWKCFIRY